jgi:hypothetical protein
MNQTVLAVIQTRNAIRRALFWRELVTMVTFFVLAWGVGALVVRYGWTGQSVHLLWGAVGVPVVGVWAWVRARGKTPGEMQVRTMLDAMSGAGGLLLVEKDQGGGAWEGSLPAMARPEFRWRDRQAMVFFGLAVVFVGAALLVPDPDVTRDPVKMRIEYATEGTKEQIDVLAKEPLVAQEKLAELKRQIERVEQEARGDNPAKTWESLDQLRRAVEQTGDDAGAGLTRLASSAQNLEALAQSLSGALKDPAVKQELVLLALKDLGKLLEREAEGKPDMQAALAEVGDLKGGMGEEEVKRLEKAMGKLDGRARQRLDELMKKGLGPKGQGDGQKGEKGEKGEGGQQALRDFLDRDDVPDSIKEACEAGEGNGGVGRGGGGAKLTFKDMESPEVANGLKPEALPEGKRDVNDARLVSVSADKPKENESGEGSTQGVLVQNVNQAGEANRQELLPIHKQAVKRYFAREEK